MSQKTYYINRLEEEKKKNRVARRQSPNPRISKMYFNQSTSVLRSFQDQKTPLPTYTIVSDFVVSPLSLQKIPTHQNSHNSETTIAKKKKKRMKESRPNQIQQQASYSGPRPLQKCPKLYGMYDADCQSQRMEGRTVNQSSGKKFFFSSFLLVFGLNRRKGKERKRKGKKDNCVPKKLKDFI